MRNEKEKETKRRLQIQEHEENRKRLEDRIDEFIKETFPASDPPNWSSLRHLAEEVRKGI
jgi:hypothetical protein